jgi:hypothetical protein
MKPNFKQLAFRDQAMAANLGVDFGGKAHFGGESKIGVEFGDDAAGTAKREMVLEPNKHSQVKIQRYAFGLILGPALALGTAAAFTGQGNPQTKFRPQRMTVNAPETGFATITTIQVANVNVLVGGSIDAFDFNANGQDQQLDMPTITPANQIVVTGNYLGDLAGRAASSAYTLLASFKGPANIVA